MRDDADLSAARLPPESPLAPQLAPPLERGRGAAELGFARDGSGATVLARLYQRTPCRILFPRPPADDILGAVLLTTSGGLTGGDRIDLSIAAAAGARAQVTTQAAEKIYRALDGEVAIGIRLDVASGAWLEWLPQETILFDRARLRRATSAEVAPGGRLLAGEMLVFGRTAHGERFARGLLHDSWRVRRAGTLAWADALRLADDISAVLDHPAGFDGAVAAATLVHVAEDAPRALDLARGLIDDGAGDQGAGAGRDGAVRGGATIINGMLVARLFGRDAQALRRRFVHVWTGLRAGIAGLPARMPAVWAS